MKNKIIKKIDKDIGVSNDIPIFGSTGSKTTMTPAEIESGFGITGDSWSIKKSQLNWFFDALCTNVNSKAAKSGGVSVGSLIWNDVDSRMMPTNSMPAFGSFWLSKGKFPELYEAMTSSITQEINGKFLIVVPDLEYPYISVVRSGRDVNTSEKNGIPNIVGSFSGHDGVYNGFCRKGSFEETPGHSSGGNASYEASMSLSYITGYPISTDNTVHPGNRAAYCHRITSSSESNEELKQALKGTKLLTVNIIAGDNDNRGLLNTEFSGTIEVPINYQETEWHHDENNNIVIDKIEYWISTSQTIVNPPDTKKGFSICWNKLNTKWEYIEDHRKEQVWNETTKDQFEVNYLGPIKEGFTNIIPPIFIQFYKFSNNSWVLDSSTKSDLIQTLVKQIKSQTLININDSKWVIENTEQIFISTEEHMQFVSIEGALTFIQTLPEKTMSELIGLLGSS